MSNGGTTISSTNCKLKYNYDTTMTNEQTSRFHQGPYSYSEEDEPPPSDSEDDQQTQLLKWRLNPLESFSDWKIEIVTKSDQDEEDKDREEARTGEITTTTYFVHKCHLAVGKRRSEYFSRLFRNSNSNNCFQESQDCTSRIELDPLAADCFPLLLDYIYAPERALEITTETATALHYLGDYFEMRYLRWDAKQFCRQNVCLANVDIYYKHATHFHSDVILNILAEFLGKNISDVATSSTIVADTDPQLWVKASKVVDPINTNHWSMVVSQVGRCHTDELDNKTLENLTHASRMPQVHADVALELCDLEDALHDCPLDQKALSSLQERCATALSKIWKDWDYTSDKAKLVHRRPSFLVDLLVKCLQEFRMEMQEANEKLQEATSVIGKFQPFPYNEHLCGGSVLVPQEIIAHNPDLHGSTCRQYNHNFAPTGYSDYWLCPVFFYANH